MTRLGITMGEPAGIGPEVLVEALCSERVQALGCSFVIYGPESLYRSASLALEGAGKQVKSFFEAVAAGAIHFEPLEHPVRGQAGRRLVEDAPAVVESIQRAVRDAQSGATQGIVTAPLDKRSLFQQGYRGWGHTELLAHLTGSPTPTMVLQARPHERAWPLRVALVTNHVPLSEVPRAFSGELLQAKARVLEDGLRRLGLPRPRLAVAGFNPHCGEQGELGTEELERIAPALESLRAGGMQIAGPLSADTVFTQAAAGKFDAVLAIYHDQGMIPVKMYGFGHGVNWTLGLPIVRTSPDHGTAYDLAGTGRAEPTSMIEAIVLAAQLTGAR